MGNNLRGESVVGEGSQGSNYDENILINQGTSDRPLPQLTFHQVHGSNIQILRGGRVAKRRESFCKGLAFSSRPIQIDENVCIRFAEVVSNWSGVLRFGVTSVDPATFRGVELPKFACPDLTTKEGYWAKALPERYSVSGSILHFYVNSEGELYYGINGVLKGQFLNTINVLSPLWVIVDIYGNSSSLEFIDQNEVRFRFTRSLASKNRGAIRPISQTSVSQPHPVATNSTSATTERHSRSSSTPRTNLPPSKYNAGVQFSPLTFHSVRGKHIALTYGYTVAARHVGEYACGYVFTSKPLSFNEKFVVQILDIEPAYNGSLAFGLTCCDPVTLQGSTLPEDSDDLLERREYWVGIKDVAAQPKSLDELSFWITERGEVYFAKNNLQPRIIVHVDISVKLWAYFDVYGSTQRIRLLGSVKINSAAPVTMRAAPSLGARTRNSHSLLNLSPETVNEARPSAEISSTQPVPIPRLIHSVSHDERTHTETGTVFTRTPSSSTQPDRRAQPVFAANGNNFADFLENTDNFHERPIELNSPNRPQFPPPPVPARTSPARIVQTRLPILSPSRSTQGAVIPPHCPHKRQQSVEDESEIGDECRICMNAKVNCVIYTCGHMSMCFECATETWHVNGDCPICRKKIEDVIRIYKS